VMDPWFERLTLTMVLLNAVEMALDVELNRNQFYQTGVSPVFVVSQNLFCVFFLAELLI
ncbi:Cacna1h, partial [Symbiodinium pilosum]